MTTKKAILAGGCFWGMQDLFRRQPGVTGSRVGYTGGGTKNPDYNAVKTGHSGHAEAIEVTYDSTRTSFCNLLEFFFQMHDPTTRNRQGNDAGSQYRSAIFYTDEEQQQAALSMIREIDAAAFLPGPVVTEVVPAGPFYEAEDYHQDYLEKNPGGYTCHFVRSNWKLKGN
ncbi:MAG: peptide-methionine (S)-S-oxide reductase MsrA [Proteobacteria bacterium]|nr:peptide-methionine (S)-S-oxide reductase MsrA [Pseudomonadota bacterium]